MSIDLKAAKESTTTQIWESVFEIYPNLKADMQAQLKGYSEMQKEYFRESCDWLNRKNEYDFRIKNGVNRASKYKHKQW